MYFYGGNDSPKSYKFPEGIEKNLAAKITFLTKGRRLYNHIMDKVAVLDKLNRALEMEEKMAGMLIELCQDSTLPDDLEPGSGRRIRDILVNIKNDTLLHKEVVMDAMKRLK